MRSGIPTAPSTASTPTPAAAPSRPAPSPPGHELLGGSRLLPGDLQQPTPGQVGNVGATAGYASASLTWSAPTSGGPVTTYTITPYIGSTAQTPTTITGNPAPTTGVVSGLTNGTTYTFAGHPVQPSGLGPRVRAVQRGHYLSEHRAAGHQRRLRERADLGGRRVAHLRRSPAPPSSTPAAPPPCLARLQAGGRTTRRQQPFPDGRYPLVGQDDLEFLVLAGHRGRTSARAAAGTYDWQEAQIRNTSGADAGQRIQEQIFERAEVDPGHLGHDAVRGPERRALVQRP